MHASLGHDAHAYAHAHSQAHALTQCASSACTQMGGNMFFVEPQHQFLKTWEATQKYLRLNLESYQHAQVSLFLLLLPTIAIKAHSACLIHAGVFSLIRDYVRCFDFFYLVCRWNRRLRRRSGEVRQSKAEMSTRRTCKTTWADRLTHGQRNVEGGKALSGASVQNTNSDVFNRVNKFPQSPSFWPQLMCSHEFL